MLVLNVSSVAAIWIGGDRIGAGEMQIGALIAFLSYLDPDPDVGDDGDVRRGAWRPAPSVCAERIQEVLDTDVVGRRRRRTRSPSSARRSSLELRDVEFHYPGAEHPVLCDISLHGRGRARPPPSSAAPARARPRCSTWSRACSTRPAARCSSTASTCATSSPSCCGAASASSRRSRTCSRAPWRATCATPTPTPPTTSCGQALEIAQAARLRAGDARRARRADRPGRHQRVGRAAPAARHRPGARAPARHLPVRRLVLGARPRDRRPAAGRAGAGHRRRGRWSSSPSGCPPSSHADQILVLEDGATGRARHPPTSCSRPARPTPRSSPRR